MQPLKILAIAMAAVPIAAFVLTLVLTDGAPLKPPPPGEESEPVVAAPPLPQTRQERQGGAGAAGHVDAVLFSVTAAGAAPHTTWPTGAVPRGLVNAKRDARVFSTLFGAPVEQPPD